ncbi:MAG: glycosyltransferase family 2 protein [Candidatus Peribacteraceae bacterium]|nr:glycosyltransferase family 2 protein [Candidatus Peribacteraceae bacterium]
MLTLVLPTYKETESLPIILPEIEAALRGQEFEVIIVDDDSPDGTAAVARGLIAKYPWLRVIRRVGRRGLSSAVIEGWLAGRGDVLAVADADGQHDLSILPALAKDCADGAAVAIGSRYVAGGSTGTWGGSRLALSQAATWLTGLLCPSPVTDPMSGFFAVRRDAFEAAVHGLRPKGFKLLMEVLVHLPKGARLAERPYTFRERRAGVSKMSLRVEVEFLESLYDLTVGRVFPLILVKYLLVGALGIVVNLAAFRLVSAFWPATLQPTYLGATTALLIAIEASILFNFLLNNVWTFKRTQLKGLGLLWGLVTYHAACALGALANTAVSTLLLLRGYHELSALIAGAGLAAAWNYTMSRMLTWKD